MAFPFLSSIINNARLIDARRREKTSANVNVVGQKNEERDFSDEHLMMEI